MQLLAMFGLASSMMVAQPVDDFPKTWEQVTSRISGAFYDRTKREDELKARFDKYAPRAKAAKSREEFSTIVNEMIAEFKDSHFGLLADHTQSYYLFEGLARGENARPAPTIGAWFSEPRPGEYTVRMVLNGQAAEAAGIRKGDVMISVGGAPFSPIRALQPLVGKKVPISWKRAGKEMNGTVDVTEARLLTTFLDATRSSAKVLEHDGKKLGYVHLWTQSPNGGFQEALTSIVMGRFGRTEGMILDLRDGFGGVPDGFSDPFWRPDVEVKYSTMTRQFGYGRPLVVIINEGSRSAKEVLSRILQTTGRATLVGSRTAGHVLGTTPMRLNDWAYLEIPIVAVTVNGEDLEGKGVTPDIKLEREFDEQGNDLFLKRALEVLADKVDKHQKAKKSN